MIAILHPRSTSTSKIKTPTSRAIYSHKSWLHRSTVCSWSRGSKEGLLCLFTCTSTRAVHLKVFTDLSMQTFLLACNLFEALKSVPQQMISDNASTYTVPTVSTSEELTELFKSQTLKKSLSKQEIKRCSICKVFPTGPHLMECQWQVLCRNTGCREADHSGSGRKVLPHQFHMCKFKSSPFRTSKDINSQQVPKET